MVDFITNAKLLWQGLMPNSETTTTPGFNSDSVVPTGYMWIILEIISCNVSGSTSTYELSVVPSGGTAGHANRVFHTRSLTAGTSTVDSMYTVMTAGDFLTGLASGADNVTLTISGIEKAVT